MPNAVARATPRGSNSHIKNQEFPEYSHLLSRKRSGCTSAATVVLTCRMLRTLTAVRLCCLAPSSSVRSSASSSFRPQAHAPPSVPRLSRFLLVPFLFLLLFSLSSPPCSSANKPGTSSETPNHCSQNLLQQANSKRKTGCRPAVDRKAGCVVAAMRVRWAAPWDPVSAAHSLQGSPSST